MKINDILTESQQQDLAEGPMLNKIGSGIGKVAGTVAKGVGAVAGGVAGAGQALKKGYQAGKGVVGAAGDTTAPTAQQVNQQGPAGTAPAKQQTGVAAQAMQKTAKAMSGQTAVKAGETLYAQVKAQVGQLDKKGKQRILQLLQKSLQQAPAAAPAQTAPAPVATPQVARKGRPVKVAGGAAKPAAAPTQQTAGTIDNRPALSESFSLYRKK